MDVPGCKITTFCSKSVIVDRFADITFYTYPSPLLRRDNVFELGYAAWSHGNSKGEGTGVKMK